MAGMASNSTRGLPMTDDVWPAAVAAIDAEFNGDLDRAEDALLEGLSRLRIQRQEGRR